jgi:hypothetical protein
VPLLASPKARSVPPFFGLQTDAVLGKIRQSGRFGVALRPRRRYKPEHGSQFRDRAARQIRDARDRGNAFEAEFTCHEGHHRRKVFS